MPASQVADLLMRQGELAANSRLSRAQIYAQLLQGLAQVPGQIVNDRQQARAAQAAAAHAADEREYRRGRDAVYDDRANRELALKEEAAQREAEEQERARQSEQAEIEQVMAYAKQHAATITQEHGPQALDQIAAVARNPQGRKALLEGFAKMALPQEQPNLMSVDPTKPLVNPKTGEVVREGVPAPEEEVAVVVRGPNGRPIRKLVPTSQLREGVEEYREPTQAPRDPLETNTTWAIDPRDGQTKPMTLAEARRIGAQQAPTADMRNKEAGKRTAARAVDAVRKLGSGIISKVGPAQRVDAIKRGAEAVFGNDPEFRTYQDSRMALAGTLAVEQQGSRVSDADVRALWLPMVPDAYRDTAESYKLKWDLIDAMRGVAPAGDAAADDAYEAYLKRQGGGGAGR